MNIKVRRKWIKSKFSNVYIWKWIIPGSILAIVIILMLTYFSVTGRQAEQKDMSKRLILQAESNANKVAEIISTMKISSSTMTDYLLRESGKVQQYCTVLNAIRDITGAYNVVICNPYGEANLADGSSVQIGSTEYFQRAVVDENYVTYTQDDGLNGREGIVVMTPFSKGDLDQYIICYYDMHDLGNVVDRRIFGDSSFFLLLDSKGRVIGKDSYPESHFNKKTDNFFSLLKEDVSKQKTVEGLWIHAKNGETGIDYYTLDGEKKAILVSPVEGSDFYFVTGVDIHYIDAAVDVQWSKNVGMVRQIVVIMLAFIGVVIVINIVTKVKENENSKKLSDIADTDLLTDLYNKAATEREIKQYLAEHPDDKGLLLILDIDNFKKINDTMGHAFGDEVLHTFGIQIRAQFRVSDIVGRTGGDEFTIYLHDVKNRETIMNQAERIEEFFHNFQAGEYVKYSATASIGAAVFPDDARDFEGLYRAADHALYVAKKRGKNQLAFYGDENI